MIKRIYFRIIWSCLKKVLDVHLSTFNMNAYNVAIISIPSVKDKIKVKIKHYWSKMKHKTKLIYAVT